MGHKGAKPLELLLSLEPLEPLNNKIVHFMEGIF